MNTRQIIFLSLIAATGLVASDAEKNTPLTLFDITNNKLFDKDRYVEDMDLNNQEKEAQNHLENLRTGKCLAGCIGYGSGVHSIDKLYTYGLKHPYTWVSLTAFGASLFAFLYLDKQTQTTKMERDIATLEKHIHAAEYLQTGIEAQRQIEQNEVNKKTLAKNQEACVNTIKINREKIEELEQNIKRNNQKLFLLPRQSIGGGIAIGATSAVVFAPLAAKLLEKNFKL